MPSPVSNLKALQHRRETGENTPTAVQASARVLFDNCTTASKTSARQSA